MIARARARTDARRAQAMLDLRCAVWGGAEAFGAAVADLTDDPDGDDA